MALGRGDSRGLCRVPLPAPAPPRPHSHRHEQSLPDHRDIVVKTPKSFAAVLSETRLPCVFNPYSDCCPIHDKPDAARVRKRNLMRFLEAALVARVDTIWIARDLGYRGGRRTGVPLTDEI